MEPLYGKNNTKTLDPRGIYVIQSEKRLVVWVGDEIQGDNEKL